MSIAFIRILKRKSVWKISGWGEVKNRKRERERNKRWRGIESGGRATWGRREEKREIDGPERMAKFSVSTFLPLCTNKAATEYKVEPLPLVRKSFTSSLFSFPRTRLRIIDLSISESFFSKWNTWYSAEYSSPDIRYLKKEEERSKIIINYLHRIFARVPSSIETISWMSRR